MDDQTIAVISIIGAYTVLFLYLGWHWYHEQEEPRQRPTQV
jgi:hypothetical protein